MEEEEEEEETERKLEFANHSGTSSLALTLFSLTRRGARGARISVTCHTNGW